MICKIKSAIEKFSMIKKGDSVIVALSGGADSMALAFFLNSVKDEYGITLSAAHVNHGIRGASADADEAFVKSFCEKNGISLHVLHADIPKIASETGETHEECGRRIRYEFFESIDKTSLIATAHNLNDNAETLLFRIARGTGLRGMCSIPPVRGRIIRPLIECSREEIEKYCSENKISYVTDETNLSDEYTRNYIRHEILPLFEKINPSFLVSANRLIDTVREDEAFLSQQAHLLFKKCENSGKYLVTDLKDAPECILKRTTAIIIEKETGMKPESSHINDIVDIIKNGGRVQICGAANFRVRKGFLEKFSSNEENEDYSLYLTEGCTEFSSYFVNASIIYKKDLTDTQKIHKQMLDIFMDCDKIIGNLVVRNKRSGDTFSPSGFNGSKKLKKMFQEKGIPPEKRSSYPVICDDFGIVAVPGFGVSKRVYVDSDSQRIWKVNFRGL